MDGEAGRKVMILGGRLVLKEFQVRGWIRQDITQKLGRVLVHKHTRAPLSRVEVIRAVSGLEAAKQYARSHQIRDSQWLDTPGDSRPYCVIRVSGMGEQAP